MRGRKSSLWWLSVWVLAGFLAGCGGDSGASAGNEEESVQAFEVKGRISSIPSDRRTVVIEHEEIPDFMPAMTMPFYLADPELAEGLEPGDTVRFRYLVAQRRSWIEEIEKIDAAEFSGAGENALRLQRRSLPIPRLEPGDTVPGFQLINQKGEPFSVADFRGEVVVLTFIFTRCPVPEFCPKMSHQFQEIQQKASQVEELKDRFHLLSVTIDPEFDSPEVLSEYAPVFSDDDSTWTFATALPDRIDEMTTRFSVYIEDNEESGTIDHILTTALIGPDGDLVRIWRGGGWEPDEVLALMLEVLKKDQQL